MEANDVFLLKIKEIMSFYNLSNNAFSQRIGVAQATFYKQATGKAQVSASVLRLILQNFPDVSAEWFMRDEGNMLKGYDVTGLGDTALDGMTVKMSSIIANLSEVLSECDKENSKLKETIKAQQTEIRKLKGE